MNRRGFLKMLGMAAPVAAVAPSYFFAPTSGWDTIPSGHSVPSNDFLSVELISMEALRILQKQLVFTDNCSRIYYDQHFSAVVKVGTPLRFRAA